MGQDFNKKSILKIKFEQIKWYFDKIANKDSEYLLRDFKEPGTLLRASYARFHLYA